MTGSRLGGRCARGRLFEARTPEVASPIRRVRKVRIGDQQ
jgi:hypothetical protein